ncbi:protein of unknown function [Paraburkholderia dioscoreae]|uniref:Uncharacterized protein n=1 Tax=Paraburkholderia dioscoreae TaxID=2604047 RepID=A0A5Q4YSZ4_9BURK|nr:protein of unknown function [Paraburkholderia dioscoreae]
MRGASEIEPKQASETYAKSRGLSLEQEKTLV